MGRNARRITAELAKASASPVQGYHRVRSGENLSVIAHRYRTSVANLKKWNNLKSNNIYPGMRLAVSAAYAKNRSTASTTTTQTTRKAGKHGHAGHPNQKVNQHAHRSPLPAQQID